MLSHDILFFNLSIHAINYISSTKIYIKIKGQIRKN